MKSKVIFIVAFVLLFISAVMKKETAANSFKNLNVADCLTLPCWSSTSYNGNAFGITNQDQGNSCTAIFGRSDAKNGKGIHGIAASNVADATNYGGYFQTWGYKGVGVYGEVIGPSDGISYGGYFSNKGNGVGAYGIVSTDTGFGIIGVNEKSGYRGFLGGASAGVISQGPLRVERGGMIVYKSLNFPLMAIDNWTEFWGKVVIRSRSGNNVILELGEGLDYAEGFNVTNETEIFPGSVLIIDSNNPGELKISETEYDKRVAGIVSGGKGNKPGVRLGVSGYDLDVALAGRVFCNVDAAYGEIKPGDLLTTSPTPGYAMVAKDPAKAQGSILGKAMEPFAKGQKGQILVLVTLQ